MKVTISYQAMLEEMKNSMITYMEPFVFCFKLTEKNCKK